MLRVAQECFSGRFGCEHAGLSFDAKLELEAGDTGNEADDGFRKVDVEIVADNVPLCGGSGAAEQVTEKPREILFRPGIACDAFDPASIRSPSSLPMPRPIQARSILRRAAPDLNVPARMLLNGDFTFCPICDFNE